MKTSCARISYAPAWSQQIHGNAKQATPLCHQKNRGYSLDVGRLDMFVKMKPAIRSISASRHFYKYENHEIQQRASRA